MLDFFLFAPFSFQLDKISIEFGWKMEEVYYTPYMEQSQIMKWKKYRRNRKEGKKLKK